MRLIDVMYERASFWERGMAFVIDLLFLKALMIAFQIAKVKLSPWALFLIYFAAFDGIAGATLGKWALGLKVVSDDAKVAGFFVGLLRCVLLVVSFFLLRPVHDNLTGTRVVKGEAL